MRHFFARESSRTSSASASRRKPVRPIGFDTLESRDMMDAAAGAELLSWNDDEGVVTAQGLGVLPASIATEIEFETGKAFYLPLPTDTPGGGDQTYTAVSDNPNIQVEVLTGRTLRLGIAVAPGGSPVGSTGFLTFQLFEDIAPIATARIIELVQAGEYNGLNFHRIIDGRFAQGGDPNGNGTGGSGVKFVDEFSPLATFNGVGQLALANSGNDVNDMQFFITDVDLDIDSTTTAVGSPPEFLNFDHTIFGQLTSGFELFDELMKTPVVSGDTGAPESPPIITSAEIITDTENGLIRVTASPGFTGTGTITVTTTDSSMMSTMDDFDVTVSANTFNDRPYLLPGQTMTTGHNTPISFQLNSVELDGTPVVYFADAAANPNATFQFDQTTGIVTVTPNPGFSGLLSVTLGVRDTANNQLFDTHVFTINVLTKVLDFDGNFFSAITTDDTELLGFVELQSTDAWFNNEIGYFVTAADGSVDGVLPGDPLYTMTALTSAGRRQLFNTLEGQGTSSTPIVQGGERVVFYLVQNGTAEDALRTNPYNRRGELNNVFFSLTTANPDGVEHVRVTEIDFGYELAFEDLYGGGDFDFNDAVLSFLANPNNITDVSTTPAFTVPGTGNRTLTFSLLDRDAALSGELGFFLVNNTTGGITQSSLFGSTTTNPNDAGYASLAISQSRTVFTSDSEVGASVTFTVPAGSILGFYIITGGDASGLIGLNPDNLSDRTPHAAFSFADANVRGNNQFDKFANIFFFEDINGGGDRDFDDYVFTISTS